MQFTDSKSVENFWSSFAFYMQKVDFSGQALELSRSQYPVSGPLSFRMSDVLWKCVMERVSQGTTLLC